MKNNKKIAAAVLAAVIGLTGCNAEHERPPVYSDDFDFASAIASYESNASVSPVSSNIAESSVSYGEPSFGSDEPSIVASEPEPASESKVEYPDIVCTVSWDSSDNAPAESSSSASASEPETKLPHIVYNADQGSSNGSSASSSSGNAPTVSGSVSISGSASDIAKICGLKSKVETSIDACIVDTYNDHNPYDVVYDYGKDYDAFVDACDWSLVFDADFYMESFPLLAMQYHDDKALLLEHFRTVGIHEGRQGNRSFNVGVYKANCGSEIKNAFGDNYEGYYFYYMLNYASKKSVKAAPSSNSKLQQKTIMTALQAAELKGVNNYREGAGVFEIEFDEELAAYANYRAYLNSHDGWKAHDWFRADDVVTTYIMDLYDAATMGENTTTVTCNTANCTSHKCNYGETRYEDYRASKSHYEAMIAAKNDLIGCGNCYKASGVVSQFDAFINL